NDYLWVSVKSTIIKNDNEVPVKAVAVVTDVTSEKSRIQKLLVEAQTDLLTGIYNKITTETFVRNALRECNFPEDKPAMMVIDIDNFKAINDNLGHMLGDAVLCEIASNLKGVFRKNDIIGRIGGDEFLVFINGKIDIPNIEEKAKEISKRFLKKFVNKGESYNVSVSIGIARCPCDGTTFEELYMHADNALYFAKSQGKECFAMFNESMRGMSQISDIKQ
ncbi:MAG: GGDEF domain-containing protein, partial [Oscillospiraceae bacterium]